MGVGGIGMSSRFPPFISILCVAFLADWGSADDVIGTSANDTPDGVQHFKLGLLAPWNGTFSDFSALTSASAVSLAIERVNNDPTLNTKMRFSVVTMDSGCSSKVSSGNAVKLFIDEQIDAFIGPACSAAARPAAELASFWNKPIVSWVATDPDFNDKSIYTTLGRTLGPFNMMGLFLVDVFKSYNWKRTVVVSSNYFLWMDAGKGIRKVFRENNITIAYGSEFERFPPRSYIENVMRKTKEEGRIVVLIVPKEDRRRFMLMAHDLGMTKGEYVFFTIEMLPEENVLNPEDVWSGNDGRDTIAREAFEAVFHVTLAALTGGNVNEFRKEVARRMRLPPWDKYLRRDIDTLSGGASSGSGSSANYAYGDRYSPFLFDAVMLYAVALNDTINRNRDTRSGVEIAANMRGKVFQGMTGNLILNMNGDREPDYWITDMVANGSFIKIAETINTGIGERVFNRDISPPRWPGGKVGHEHAPPDVPLCGFRNELCPDEKVAEWIIALSIVLAILAITAAVGLGIYLYRRNKFEAGLLVQSWRVNWEDIEPLSSGNKRGGSTPTLSSINRSIASRDIKDLKEKAGKNIDPSKSSQSRSMPSVGTGGGQIFSDIGLHKGVVIALKHVKKDHVLITREVAIEFNRMKDVVHENLNVFVGACVDPPHICLIWHYCAKGGLQDVLENESYKLDNNFKLSFMTDIAKGMHYLHSTHLVSHGNLKSANCLIDSRWTIKITDYGLPTFLAGQDFTETDTDVFAQFKRKLWTSPELLRENFPPPRGTQKGDVYSFAIISYEIMMRSEPFNFDNITPRDVVNRIRNGESVPYRPTLPESSELGKPLIDMLKICWDENAEARPNFSQIRASLRKITGGEINVMDTVMAMMEKYGNNLEEMVEERTQQLVEEKKKTDRLLYRMLPQSAAEQLKAGKSVQPENYDQATVYFSDVVGFANMATDSNPMQIVDFLNDLYSTFDDIIAKHDVYKVETIGDAYMCVSGVPVRNGNRHAAEIANCSLDLLSVVTHFKIRHRPNKQLQLRIGLHSGPVVAGVVGLIMPRYCLFGDTVNMTARMETSGKPLRIHVSKNAYIALTEIGGYEMTLRGEMTVKGKGIQTTYWLHGKKGYDKPLPAFDREQVMKEESVDVDNKDTGRAALMQTYDSLSSTQKEEPAGAASGMPAVV